MSTKSMSRPDSAKVVPLTPKSTDTFQNFSSNMERRRLHSPEPEDALYERHLVFDRAIDPKVCERPRALRSVLPFRARRSGAALGENQEHLRAAESQAHLLPLDGVSHRPFAGQQRYESVA